ncbi:MAG: XkdX family protein [Eubacteriales bacterium]|jgi:hypothetical protein
MKEFWALAYNRKCVTIETLRIVVKTDENPYGYITPEEFKEITGEDFELHNKSREQTLPA